MKKIIMVGWGTIFFLGLGVFLLVDGDIGFGTVLVLFGLAAVAALIVEVGKRRGDPRAGGLHESNTRGPYLALVIAVFVIGVAIGVLYIVVTPTTQYRGLVRTPTEARIFGTFIAVVSGGAVVAGVRRWLRSRQRGGPAT